MKTLLKYIFIFLTFNVMTLYSQLTYESLDNEVYNFLGRINLRGVIEFDDYIRPLSRKYISSKILELISKEKLLTSLEREELKFYSREYGVELDTSKSDYEGNLTLFGKDEYKTWRPFSFRNTHLYFDVTPIIGYEKGRWDDVDYDRLQLGASMKGALGDVLGFSFKLRQFRLEPFIFNIPFLYRFTKSSGINATLGDIPRQEYHYLDVSMGTDWSWGSLSIGKNNTTFGHEKSGNVILSNRPTSYPNIRLTVEPFNWLSFDFLHGWLNSNIYDSTSFYSTFRYQRWGNTDRKTYIQKYLAIHSITAKPFKGFSVSLGESIIYSYALREEYLIPLFPFFIDGGISGNRDNSDNYQWFVSMSSKNHIPNTHIYANFLADDLSVSSNIDRTINYSKYALSLGAIITDLPFNNLTLTMEYSKIYPAVYQHSDPTLTYVSSGYYKYYGYYLGHWAGDNTELFYGSLNYRIARGLEGTLWGQIINKGTEASGDRGHQSPEPTFLFSDNPNDRKKYTYLGLDLRYEIYHYLVAKFNLILIEESTKQIDGSYKNKNYKNLAFTIGYGI